MPETFPDFEFDWVTSDTHFSHARIVELSRRPFSSVEQMNGEIIKRWNQVVKPDDKVLHTGDMSMGKFPESVALTSALNGCRFLIPGNHDRVSSVFDKGKSIERFAALYEQYGWTILPEVIGRVLAGRKILLSHYPYDGDSRPDRPDRHASVRPKDEGLPIVHGHVHTDFAVRGRQFNVGVDVRDFRPVHRSEIEAWLETLAA